MSHSNQSRQIPDEALISSMQLAGLLEEPAEANFSILTGGVASEIWKVETRKKSYSLNAPCQNLTLRQAGMRQLKEIASRLLGADLLKKIYLD